MDGRVPIAIADPRRVLLVKSALTNRRMSVREHLAPDGVTVIAPIDDLSGSAFLKQLHAELEWPSPIALDDKESTRDIRFEFRRPAARRTITIVARTVSDEPCPGIDFCVSVLHEATAAQLPVAFVRTDESGHASSPSLASGRYLVSLQKVLDHYRPVVNEPIEVALRDPGNVEVRFTFESHGSLRGQLRLVPARRGAVAVYEFTDSSIPFIRTITTEEDGQFELKGIPRGRYVAVSWPSGYMETSVEFVVAAGRTTDVVLAPQQGGAGVVGRFEGSDGKPLAHLGININTPLRYGDHPSGSGFGTDAEGRLNATGVAEGPKLAIIWKLGYLRRFSVAAGATSVDLGTFRLPRPAGAGSIEGRVTDERGEALRGTLVCVTRDGAEESWIRFVRSDGVGGFRFDGVEPGRYRLSHEPIGATNYVLERAPEEIVVGTDGTRHDLRLSRP